MGFPTPAARSELGSRVEDIVYYTAEPARRFERGLVVGIFDTEQGLSEDVQYVSKEKSADVKGLRRILNVSGPEAAG